MFVGLLFFPPQRYPRRKIDFFFSLLCVKFLRPPIGITLKVLLFIEVGKIRRFVLSKAFFEQNASLGSAFLSPK
ncbi:MAG: hypothetical protein ACLTVB_09265, partial [Sutterella sp.]